MFSLRSRACLSSSFRIRLASRASAWSCLFVGRAAARLIVAMQSWRFGALMGYRLRHRVRQGNTLFRLRAQPSGDDCADRARADPEGSCDLALRDVGEVEADDQRVAVDRGAAMAAGNSDAALRHGDAAGSTQRVVALALELAAAMAAWPVPSSPTAGRVVVDALPGRVISGGTARSVRRVGSRHWRASCRAGTAPMRAACRR